MQSGASGRAETSLSIQGGKGIIYRRFRRICEHILYKRDKQGRVDVRRRPGRWRRGVKEHPSLRRDEQCQSQSWCYEKMVGETRFEDALGNEKKTLKATHSAREAK